MFDQRGIGLSDKPESGYDAGAQANDMVALLEALGHRRFAMIGFDTGMPIGSALADHGDCREMRGQIRAVTHLGVGIEEIDLALHAAADTLLECPVPSACLAQRFEGRS